MTTTVTRRWATQEQVDLMKNLLTEHQLYDGHYDRLWKLLMVHETDVAHPGDGTRMPYLQASRTIDWLRAQIAKKDRPDIPAGHYATPSRTGSNDLDFWRVDRPGTGRWAGATFVVRVIGGHPDTNIRGTEARQALEAIAKAGVETSRTLYGQEIGQCWKCNRHLTDELSRELGIGPDCCEAVHGIPQVQLQAARQPSDFPVGRPACVNRLNLTPVGHRHIADRNGNCKVCDVEMTDPNLEEEAK